MIVVGSMISLGYYLPVIAAMWMREAPEDAPGTSPAAATAARRRPCRRSPGARPSSTSPPGRRRSAPQPEVVLVAVLAGAATLFFGIVPQPLFNLVHGAGAALGLLSDLSASAGALQAPGGLGGLLGILQLALDEVQPGLPEARVGEVDADDLPELLRASRATSREQLQIARHER